MAPRKRQRDNEACSALALAPPPTLPADLLLEIVARSDVTTIIRCAAACRLLRGRILTAAFIQQVFAGVVPKCVLTRLHARRPKRPHQHRKPLVSLVYPTTPAASSLVGKHLGPFVSRRAADLLSQYEPVTSRGGLVVLRLRRRSRCHSKWCAPSSSDLCVYDPMTDARTFFSEPPDIHVDSSKGTVASCVLLTAADGIGCRSFQLLVANMMKDPTDSTLEVQTSSPSDAGDISWGPVTESESVCHSGALEEKRGVVVLPGGVVHWLTRDHQILTYDVRTGKSGTVKHPDMPHKHHLTMSPDGRLRILAVQGFMISVWEQLSAGGWSPCATIDTEEKLRSMHLDILFHGAELLELRSEEIRSNAVLLQIHGRVLLQVDDRVVVLDLETKEMGKQEGSSSSCLFEVDLLARLQAMRIF